MLSPTSSHATPCSLKTSFCGSVRTTAVSFLLMFICRFWFYFVVENELRSESFSLLGRFLEKRSEIQRLCDHRQPAVGSTRPLFFGAIPIKLHPVTIGI